MHQIKTIVRSVATCALTSALVLQGTPIVAFGLTSQELQAQLDEARVKLDELGTQVVEAGEELHETQYQLEQTGEQIEEVKGQISQREVELDEAQEILKRRVASNYKTGGTGLASLLMDVDSFDDLVSRLYYATKVYESDEQIIQNVKDIRASLKEDQASLEKYQEEQETLLAQQTEQVEELKAQEAAQAEYVDNLDAEVAAKLEEERQAELERQRREAEEAARIAAEQARIQAEKEEAERKEREQAQMQAQAQAQAETENQEEPTEEGGEENEGSEGTETYDTPSYESEDSGESSGGGSLTQSQRNTIISAAYSQVGVPYSFGSSSPGVGFDCSGFTMWCYAQAGVSLPHSAAAQSGVTSSVSYDSLQPGDLVFWIGTGDASLTGNHVALYLGGGTIIHAVWSGVTTQSLYSGVTKYGAV